MEEKTLIDCSRLLTDEEIEAVPGGSLLNDIKTVAGDIWRLITSRPAPSPSSPHIEAECLAWPGLLDRAGQGAHRGLFRLADAAGGEGVPQGTARETGQRRSPDRRSRWSRPAAPIGDKHGREDPYHRRPPAH